MAEQHWDHIVVGIGVERNSGEDIRRLDLTAELKEALAENGLEAEAVLANRDWPGLSGEPETRKAPPPTTCTSSRWSWASRSCSARRRPGVIAPERQALATGTM